MSDGTSLRESWYGALNDAQINFRRLLTSSSAPEWKRIPTPSDISSNKVKGKARSTIPDLADVVIHRKASKAEDPVCRVVLDVSTGDEPVSLETWKSVLATPELRKEWDPAVEAASLVEMFDPTTRIAKTNFTLGWPANPRDAVTISRTFNDATTVIDISTSLPRSIDEPAYLRPSPPYVRSNVKLFAWCIQYVPSSSTPPSSASTSTSSSQPDDSSPKKANSGRLRITCFWQHDLRAAWNFNSSSSMFQQLASMVLGLFKTVIKRGTRVPLLTGYGNGVTIERVRFEVDREALTLDYTIIPEDDDHPGHSPETSRGLDELHALREYRRLTRSVEFSIPLSEGWDIQLTTRASSEALASLPWSAHVLRNGSVPSSSKGLVSDFEDVLFRINHAALLDDHSLLKVRVAIERSGPSGGLRLNGIPQPIEEIEDRNPSSYFMSQQMLQDATSTAELSFQSLSSATTGTSTISSGSKTPMQPHLVRALTERSAAAEKSILSRIRRNYIYFSSLLQEPEAKWKRTTEARGVSVTQLDSIDPTLVVYRAEATFVGVGLWDLYAAITSPGAHTYWDKGLEDAVLLEDVNELTELWHIKTRPAWPANPRDSVLLKTVYKSPSTVHVFAFSADEPNLFPNIPPVEPTTIRTQVDLQGFAIEALSPTTTLLTLLEQSDPKGWSGKASIPQQMITALAGVGEFAIKCGGPPALTRLSGAKTNQIRYDHERGSFRIEYEASRRRAVQAGDQSSVSSSDATTDTGSATSMPIIECELRCDIDTWASSLDIVVDPPPQSISCLRRHRLSSGGGGLWLTITHDAVLASDERLMTIVRKGPGRERGAVMVNGARVTVDVEDLPESELKSLSKQKRVKPARIPLDQPPVLGVIRRRKAEWSGENDENGKALGILDGTFEKKASPTSTPSSIWTASAPKFPSPLARYFSFAMEQAVATTEQAVAAISPASNASSDPMLPKPPMDYALQALSYLQQLHSRSSSPTATSEWTIVSDKGFPIHRKAEPSLSPTIPVYKGEKVIEGVSAEEIAAVVATYECRRRWDDKFGGAQILESFGGECHTAFVVQKGGFPFRDRGFYVASLVARSKGSQDADEGRTAILVASASFSPASAVGFASAKYNPYNLPIGRMFVDGWILETLDPYTPENYAIPSTRCTRVVAADYAGSVPAAVNAMNNTALAKAIVSVEAYVKSIAPLPFTRLPGAGVVLTDKGHEEQQGTNAWTLRRRDENRSLVQTWFMPEERIYRSSLLLTLPVPSPVRAASTSPKPASPAESSGSPSQQTISKPALTPSSDSSSSEPISTPFTSRAHSLSLSVPSGSTAAPKHRRVSSTTIRTAAGEAALKVSSSAFTLRGEVRQHTDLLVAEIIVDSKLYDEGYDVQLRSRIHDTSRPISLTDHRGLSAAQGSKDADEDADSVLPLTYTVHTIPLSPMHSSGLTVDSPPRHLVRLMLPTAQHQISTLQDPLTGETRSPPPKPQWLVDLQEKGAVVDVEIRPGAAINAKNSVGRRKAKAGVVVRVDGTIVNVEGEKESLTSLGREELQDDRVARLTVLTRHSNGEDELPRQLHSPLAISEHLLYPSSQSEPSQTSPESKEAEDGSVSPESIQEPTGPNKISSTAPTETAPPTPATGGLLGFFNSYQNPLSRFTSPSGTGSSSASTTSTAQSPTAGSEASAASRGLGNEKEFREDRLTAVREESRRERLSFPLSSVLVIALIAFLMGSLLRSLISPADFVYVATDVGDAEGLRAGWREVKRLLEVKYIVGGWDFQIAVVRRH